MSSMTWRFLGSGFVLLLVILGIIGNPVTLKKQSNFYDSKPPSCPHGLCFIDRCTRICSCVPPEGTVSCTNNLFKSPMDCKPEKLPEDNCPLGETYRSPHWQNNFVCFCNHNPSQTYACYDTASKQPADARDLPQATNHRSLATI